MSSIELQRMGIMAYVLTEDEIRCLENLDDDAVANLGTLDKWTQIQVKMYYFDFSVF